MQGLPHSMFSEMAAMRLIHERAAQDGTYLNFLGAGAYEHHIPVVVSQLAARGDFCANDSTTNVSTNISAQPAADVQGTLQLQREFQDHMAALLALDAVSGRAADGACALAEAVIMAVCLHHGGRRVLMPRTLHPLWRGVVRTFTRHQRIELVDVPYNAESGQTVLDGVDVTGCAALIIPQPNFFGVLESADDLTEWAHARKLLVIGAVNPLALALLRPPGEWGARGAEFAAGDAQPLGLPPSGSAGFIACREKFASGLPHSNAAHAPVAAAAYLAVMGAQGLGAVARASAANTAALMHALAGVNGIQRAFSAPVFHEFVIKLATPVAPVLHALKAQGILGGIPLTPYFPEVGQSLLVCATETKTVDDIARYADNMTRIIGKRFQPAPCAIKPGRIT